MGCFRTTTRVRLPTLTNGINFTGGDSNMSEAVTMQRYKCHKEVSALKIAKIEQSPADKENDCGGTWELIPENENCTNITVSHAWYCKHLPKEGGYYVVYDDGYASFSPAQAFESGYTLLE